MNLLKKLAKNENLTEREYKTDNFFFGAEEAEAEANPESSISLIDFFEDYLGVIKELDSQKFIIIGRKGSGKSAIAEYICGKAKDDSNAFSSFIRANDLKLNKLAQYESETGETVSALFEWVILLKLVEFIVENEALSSVKEFGNLKKFYSKNSGFISILEYEKKEMNRRDSIGVNSEYLNRFFKFVFKTDMSVKESRAPYYKLIPDLRKVVLKALSSEYDKSNGNSYYIFFDDLDINFNARDSKDVNNVAELIRIAKQYNNIYFGQQSIDAKIVILIRDDIINVLDTHSSDIAKVISSYSIMLNWYDYYIFKNDIKSLPIKRMVDKRIVVNFEKNAIPFGTEPWLSFVDESEDFKFFKTIIDVTFSRPRDIIMFFSKVNKLRTNFPLNWNMQKKLEKMYYTRAISEMKNEMAIYYGHIQIEAVFSALKKLNKNGNDSFGFSQLKRELENSGFSGDIEEVAVRLFDRSMIGQCIIDRGSSRLLKFKYREPVEAPYVINLSERFTLHKAISRHFAIQDSRA